MRSTVTTIQRLILLAPVLLTLALLPVLAVSAPWGVTLLWLFLVGLSWYSYLSIPHVALLKEGILHCERPMGRLQIPTRDIRKIDARRWNRGFASVSAQGRTTIFLRAMPGLLEMLVAIVAERGDIVVQGDLSSGAR